MEDVERATAAFQHALTTRAGCECIAHVLQGITELDLRTTVMCIDGIGACDLISRSAMMQGSHKVHAAAVLFVFMFCGTASTHLWEDDEGTTHKIVQGEGGEQGDVMMTLLFSLGQHPALEAVQAQLISGELLFAYLDDIYVVSSPERAGTVYTLLQPALWRVAGIRIHQAKTKIWNRLGVKPEICDALERMARIEDPTARVWRGVRGAHGASGNEGVGHTSWPQGLCQEPFGEDISGAPLLVGQDSHVGGFAVLLAALGALCRCPCQLHDVGG